MNAPLRINAPSQKSEKITVYSSLTQDQILINFYNAGITAYTSRKIKTKLMLFKSPGKMTLTLRLENIYCSFV